MNNRIYINGNNEITLKPSDAATEGILNHLISAQDRRLYACIRAFGCSTLEAVVASFSKTLSGHPDALSDFAAQYETTGAYRAEYRDVCDSIGEERLKHEWAKRCEELSVAARDAAMQLRVALIDYKPEVREGRVRRDEAAWMKLCAERSDGAALEGSASAYTPSDWERIAEDRAQAQARHTIKDHSYTLHGKDAEGQNGRSGTQYDSNTVKTHFQ
ncbi:hypothetical protein V4C53_30155 [Paraburkholderia azotifigens]|uniref:hypothetical protein n=1 Tax=Paraburkholderia azotifigens TaxID=2057004 RepID=UPI003171148E